MVIQDDEGVSLIGRSFQDCCSCSYKYRVGFENDKWQKSIQDGHLMGGKTK